MFRCWCRLYSFCAYTTFCLTKHEWKSWRREILARDKMWLKLSKYHVTRLCKNNFQVVFFFTISRLHLHSLLLYFQFFFLMYIYTHIYILISSSLIITYTDRKFLSETNLHVQKFCRHYARLQKKNQVSAGTNNLCKRRDRSHSFHVSHWTLYIDTIDDEYCVVRCILV